MWTYWLERLEACFFALGRSGIYRNIWGFMTGLLNVFLANNENINDFLLEITLYKLNRLRCLDGKKNLERKDDRLLLWQDDKRFLPQCKITDHILIYTDLIFVYQWRFGCSQFFFHCVVILNTNIKRTTIRIDIELQPCVSFVSILFLFSVLYYWIFDLMLICFSNLRWDKKQIKKSTVYFKSPHSPPSDYLMTIREYEAKARYSSWGWREWRLVPFYDII